MIVGGASKYTLDSGSLAGISAGCPDGGASFEQDPLLHIALLNNPSANLQMSQKHAGGKPSEQLNAYEQYLNGANENSKTL